MARHLVEHGYRVLNFDRQPFDQPHVPVLIGDITDHGQVMNAMTSHFGFGGLSRGAAPGPVDAVVHLAAVPRILICPDNETFRVNVMGTYTVLETAMKLGVSKVVMASSETTLGVCFAQGDIDFSAFPITESHPTQPMDSYGLSKVVNEQTAQAFAKRFGADIYALRIGNVIEPNEYNQFERFLDHPETRRRNAWSYIDARDLGEMVRLGLETDGLGYQVFNAVNDHITCREPAMDILSRFAPTTPVTAPLSARQAPISNAKAREMLGFRPLTDWREEVARLGLG